MNDLPIAIAELVQVLTTMPGVRAVVLGGSRAAAAEDAHSDWDLGVYYRGSIDLTLLADRGRVFPPGAWGRVMNGGAWLRCGSDKVDVLLRDLDVVEHWARRAEDGEFERDALLGYLAGIPTYTLSAELASCRTLYGELPASPFPAKLAAAAPPVWRFCRSFSLDYARIHAKRGDFVGAMGQAAAAVMAEAHAIMCERNQWVCSEKRLAHLAGLDSVQSLFAQVPAEPRSLVRWVDQVAARLGAKADEVRPWK